MLQDVWATIRWGLGLDAQTLTLWQMALRAIIIYVATLVMVRLGQKRFLGKNTAFDVILGIILGSVVSRAINGTAPFFPTVTAGFVLVGLHWLFAVIAFHSDHLGVLFKGNSCALIDEGVIRWENMRKNHISKRDLLEALRLNGQLTDPNQTQVACFERSGDISVIPREREPRVVEVVVEAGVQTVRIELS